MPKYAEGINQLISNEVINERDVNSLTMLELGTLENEGVQKLIADGKLSIADFKGLTVPELGTLECSACKQYDLAEPNYGKSKLRGGMFRQEHENNSSRSSFPSFEA